MEDINILYLDKKEINVTAQKSQMCLCFNIIMVKQ